jgi:diguanylate cyclase (GGDEF)-like protein
MPDVPFDDLVALVAQRFHTKTAAVCRVGPDRVRLGSPLGQSRCSDTVAGGFCHTVADTRSTLVVPDAVLSGRFAGDAAVTGSDLLRFFAGVPLLSKDGVVLGVLSTWDPAPRAPSSEDIMALEQFGRHASTMIELHCVAVELGREREVLATTGYLLEMIVAGADLPSVLEALAHAAEAAIDGTRCSIHLLEGNVLRQGASPSLPEAYRLAIDGAVIGPLVGSCGSAAYTGRMVIVPDIETDPRWADWWRLAVRHGLRACWSVPIVGVGGVVLGTFALYYDEVKVPGKDDLERLGRWVNLAEVAITRARDITALRTAATLDPLTSLVNRTEVTTRIRAAVDGPGHRAAVLFLDLDQFKFVNDALGHAAGDEFLRVVAARLTDCADPEDTVARFGGDEFLVLRPQCHSLAELEALARRMISIVHRPITINGHSLSLSASVGIALQHADSEGAPADLVSDADLAMYAAKRTGRNSVAVFSPGLRAAAAARLSLEADLSVALVNGELDCAYQPTIAMDSGRILDVEALLRWNSPTRGSVPPLSFISVAEASGLIRDLGKFVLLRACRQMVAWRSAAAWQDVVIWVNVSGRQLLDPGFVGVVEKVLGESGLPSGNLGLEVTESTFIEDSEMARSTLLQLRTQGVHVAIDDFGTGYSSLAQLEYLPVDVLKIDRQFTAEISTSETRVGLVSAILTLAATMGLRVVVEGVETQQQRELLLELGCRTGQGFLWSKPIPAEAFNGSRWQFATQDPVTGARGDTPLAP